MNTPEPMSDDIDPKNQEVEIIKKGKKRLACFMFAFSFHTCNMTVYTYDYRVVLSNNYIPLMLIKY